MPPPCAACAAPAAPLACARCKCAFYCGAACQRAAWGAHKGACVAGAADGLPALVKLSKPYRCSTCGADAAWVACLACGCAIYCDERCQRASWPAHRDACRAAATAPKVKDAFEQSRCSQCNVETPYHRKLCGRCHTVAYCGEACARAHWTGGHRGACVTAGAALVAYVRLQAEAGYENSMYNLGLYYSSGVGVTADAAAAVAWYTRAAEAGQVDAQFNLGNCYRKGLGVIADAAVAFKWFTCAADAGDASAMNSLAVCYDKGVGVAVDSAEAIALFTRAAEAGNAVAQSNLGLRYLGGTLGVARDLAKAREWLERATAGGYEPAVMELAKLDATAPK